MAQTLYRRSFSRTARTRLREQPRVEQLESRDLPATFTWLNNVTGNFNDPTKWDQGSVPGVNDDVVISFGGVTVTSSASATVKSLTSAGTLSVTGGTFTTTNGGALTGTVNVAVGTLFDITGGSFAWNAGTISGAGTFRINTGGALAIGGAGTKTLDTTTLNNLGSVTWTGA